MNDRRPLNIEESKKRYVWEVLFDLSYEQFDLWNCGQFRFDFEITLFLNLELGFAYKYSLYLIIQVPTHLSSLFSGVRSMHLGQDW